MVKIYISFAGRCAEAIAFYENAFGRSVEKLVRYSDLPDGDGTDNNVLHSEMTIEGSTFIFSDYLSPMIAGDNFSILLEVDSDEKVREYYHGLCEDAEIAIALGPLELPGESCSLYANFKDKFGINWIIMRRAR